MFFVYKKTSSLKFTLALHVLSEPVIIIYILAVRLTHRQYGAFVIILTKMSEEVKSELVNFCCMKIFRIPKKLY